MSAVRRARLDTPRIHGNTENQEQKQTAPPPLGHDVHMIAGVDPRAELPYFAIGAR